MVVVDVSDEVLAVVVEIQSLLEELSRSGHILLQNIPVRLRIARELTDVPKVGSSEQCVEHGIVRIMLKGCLKLGLHVRYRVVLVPVINVPESFDRRIARASDPWPSRLARTKRRAEKAECDDAQERRRNNWFSLHPCTSGAEYTAALY